MEPATVWAYREALSDLSVEELEQGCTEAMRQTKFTPTPAEIREYGMLPKETVFLNNALPEPYPTKEEAIEFLAKMKAEVPCLSEESLRKEGVVIITDEMRAEYQRKKSEALKRFGTDESA